MGRAKTFFHPIEGSGPLTIMWYSGPTREATEAKEETGVGFFTPSGELQSVTFDEVDEKSDHQKLTFDNGTKVTIWMTDGKVRYKKTSKRKNQAA